MYVNVKCPNIYMKNKTFIIRSYISVSSKPSKTQYIFGYIYNMYISALKVGNKSLHYKPKCSILSKAILIGEETAHTYVKIKYCQLHAWQFSDDQIYYTTYKEYLLLLYTFHFNL